MERFFFEGASVGKIAGKQEKKIPVYLQPLSDYLKGSSFGKAFSLLALGTHRSFNNNFVLC